MNLAANIGEFYRYIDNKLKESGVIQSERDARYIMLKRADVSWSDLITAPNKTLAPDCVSAILSDVEAYIDGKPLSRIYGEREFYGLDFNLSPETLDPRIDTEVIVDIALNRLNNIDSPLILDLGTGSGCILLSILAHLPKAQGVGVDLSFQALKTAVHNSKRLGVNDRVSFICGDWGESLSRKFDVIVSNPPYIASETIQNLHESVKKYDPIHALDGGEDGMQAYKKIFLQLPSLLKSNGLALFEIGFDQEESILRLSKESRFLLKGVHRDSGAQPRVAEICFLPEWG